MIANSFVIPTFQAADGNLEAEREREAEEALREEREAKELLLREAKEEVVRLKRQVRSVGRVCQKVGNFLSQAVTSVPCGYF